jgi:hypothetical protein
MLANDDIHKRGSTMPERAIVITRAGAKGFLVALDPPGAQSSVNRHCLTYQAATEYAEGVALALACPVLDRVAVEGFDGVAGVIELLRKTLPPMSAINQAAGPASIGPSVEVPAVFVHLLIAEIETLRARLGEGEGLALLTGAPAGSA